MLAAIETTQTDRSDRLLAMVACKLVNAGYMVSGALRVADPEREPATCETTLKVLPDGPVVRITQDLGQGSAACRMDAGAIEKVVGLATARFQSGQSDFVVLNKFGLSEAQGRGFRSLIGLALQNRVPVLTTVGKTHRAAFDRFAEGMATILPPDEGVVLDWCRQNGPFREKSAWSEPKLNHPEWQGR